MVKRDYKKLSLPGIEDLACIYIPPIHPKSATDLGEETRYKSLFFGLDLTRDFYFSYTYDLTHPFVTSSQHLGSSTT